MIILRAHYFSHDLPVILQLNDVLELMTIEYPFKLLKTHAIDCTCNYPTFGLCFLEDDLNRRACIKEIFKDTSASKLVFKKRDIIGAYVVTINYRPVYALAEVNRAILDAFISNSQIVNIELALHKYQDPIIDEHLPIIQDN